MLTHQYDGGEERNLNVSYDSFSRLFSGGITHKQEEAEPQI